MNELSKAVLLSALGLVLADCTNDGSLGKSGRYLETGEDTCKSGDCDPTPSDQDDHEPADERDAATPDGGGEHAPDCALTAEPDAAGEDAAEPDAATLTCTRTGDHWLTHPERWPIDGLDLGGMPVSNAQLQIFVNNATGPYATLLAAYLVVQLNLAAGTAPDAGTTATLADAEAWLTLNSPTTLDGSPEGSEARHLAGELNRYNEGELGPGVCPPEPVCTHSEAFWLAFPEAWEIDGVLIGTTNVANTLVRSVLDNRSGPFRDVLGAYVTARLNIAAGAAADDAEALLAEAATWLANNRLSTSGASPEGMDGARLAAALTGYNDGTVGPGACAVAAGE